VYGKKFDCHKKWGNAACVGGRDRTYGVFKSENKQLLDQNTEGNICPYCGSKLLYEFKEHKNESEWP
jgi:DNA-directed RNA polymerase subunit RPC12/RpoP